MRHRLIAAYKKLFVRRAFLRLHQRLLNLSLWGLGILNSEDPHVSGEAAFIHQLWRYIPKRSDPVVFDVGANIGSFSRMLLAEHPTAQIYAFEPHPTTYQQLVQHVKGLPVRSYNLALSNTAGGGLLFDHAHTATSHASLFREVIAGLHGDLVGTHEVSIITLDQFVQEHQIEQIDLLKLDAEGSELRILAGAQTTIAAGKIMCIQFEFNEMNVVSRVFLRDFMAVLPEYTLYRMLPDGLVPIQATPVFLSEIFAYQNIVALRKA